MSQYTVKFYTGDYVDRQEEANKDGAICYVEHHLNSREYKDERPGLEDNPILTVVAHNASGKSKNWASFYSKKVYQAFEAKISLFNPKDPTHPGVLQRAYRERGDYNLRFTNMPAILPEPFWLSDEEQVKLLMKPDGSTVRKLAECLEQSIRAMFPEGGLVAFSIGHMGKKSQPFDRGAPVRGVPETSEAEICKEILNVAALLLSHPHRRIVPESARPLDETDVQFLARILWRNVQFSTPFTSSADGKRLQALAEAGKDKGL